MTVQQIINLALSNTHTKSSQLTAANMILYFNLSRNTVAKAMVAKLGEKFFFQIWDIDAEDNTNADRSNGEYSYPQVSSSEAGMKKLDRLVIKGYDTDTYFINAREIDPRTLSHDWLWYMKNQPKSDPIYFIGDQSFFIAPEFKAADLPDNPIGNKQIKCYGVASLTYLVVTALEAAVLVPSDQHELIALGMEKYIYKSRKKKKEAFDSLAEFDKEIEVMVGDLTNRDDSFMQASIPSDEHLE